jgi:hypothetical protein
MRLFRLTNPCLRSISGFENVMDTDKMIKEKIKIIGNTSFSSFRTFVRFYTTHITVFSLGEYSPYN